MEYKFDKRITAFGKRITHKLDKWTNHLTNRIPPCHLVLSTRRVLATVLTILLQCFLSAVTSLSSASFIPVTSCISSIHFSLVVLSSSFYLRMPASFFFQSI